MDIDMNMLVEARLTSPAESAARVPDRISLEQGARAAVAPCASLPQCSPGRDYVRRQRCAHVHRLPARPSQWAGPGQNVPRLGTIGGLGEGAYRLLAIC